MTNDSVLEWISEEQAHALYAHGDAAHDFDHVRRVAHLARHLAQAEGADIAVVVAAALLHDVPVAQGEAARADHHMAAAAFARAYLAARGMPAPQVANVGHCIEAHRFRDAAIVPQTLEARCLYDADKLDSIGAIGVARAFAYAGAHGNRLWWLPVAAIEMECAPPPGDDYTPVHEFVYKLRRLLDTLQTATGRQLGQERHNLQAAFFAALDAEMAVLDDIDPPGGPTTMFKQGNA